MRKAFSEIVAKLGREEPKLAFITGDLGFQVFDVFEKECGPRYVNVGVAEAQMVYVAAGMAAEGWRPIAYSIASFAVARPFEQIRFCIAYPNLPVTLVGAGRGYTYSTSGVSHHAVDDIALMSSMPNMRVVTPGDPGEIEALFPQVIRSGVPTYFTVGRFGEPRYQAEEPAVVGKARLLRGGKTLAILTSGEIANEALAALEPLKTAGITPMVYQFHTVKPLDTAALEAIAKQVGAMVIVEEHLPTGGLFAAVASWHALTQNSTKIYRLGPPDIFQLGTLERDELRRRLGMNGAGIAEFCKSVAAKL